MNNYVAIQGQLQSILGLPLKSEWSRLKNWLAVYRQFLARKALERQFASLDRSTLEDIGVPHDHVSLRAGPLDRYPYLIFVRSNAC